VLTAGRPVADVRGAGIPVVAAFGMRQVSACIGADIFGAGDSVVAVRCTSAIPIAARIREGADTCVVAVHFPEPPGAAPRRGIAGIVSADVAIIAVDVGVGAQARGFNAAVVSAWVKVVAVGSGALAHQGPCLIHASSAGSTQAAIVAGITGIHKVTPADSAFPAGVGGGASIAVGAGRAEGQEGPPALPAGIAHIGDRAAVAVVAGGAQGQCRVLAGAVRTRRAGIGRAGVSVVTVDWGVPTGPVNGIAVIHGAAVEIVARGAGQLVASADDRRGAAPRRGVAGIRGADIAIIAIDRRIRTGRRRRVAYILGAWASVRAAHRGAQTEGHALCIQRTNLSGGASRAVVARGTQRKRMAQANTGGIADVRAGAWIEIITNGAFRKRAPSAYPGSAEITCGTGTAIITGNVGLREIAAASRMAWVVGGKVAAGIQRAGVSVITVEWGVPAGSVNDIAGVHRAGVEIFARRTGHLRLDAPRFRGELARW